VIAALGLPANYSELSFYVLPYEKKSEMSRLDSDEAMRGALARWDAAADRVLTNTPSIRVYDIMAKKTSKRAAGSDVLTTEEALNRDMSSVQLYTLRHLKAATRCDRHSINGDTHCLVVGNGHMKLDHQRLAVWATEMIKNPKEVTVLRPPNMSLFDAFHQPNRRGAAGAASAASADVLKCHSTATQYPASPPIAAINNGERTVKAESSVDSVTIMSPPRRSAAIEPDVFTASTSYKRPIAQVLDENFMLAGSSQKRVKVEGPTVSPIIDVSSSSGPGSPASSGSSSGLEELTNTPTKLRITASAARALGKRGLHSRF